MGDNDWKKRLGVVYSTNPDFNYDAQESAAEAETLAPARQKLLVSLERSGRAGRRPRRARQDAEDALRRRRNRQGR